MTVDEILAGWLHEDRRGIGWMRHPVFGWFSPEIELPNGGYRHLTESQMRLLIERDMHRDECRGIFDCDVHPVPTVFTELGWFYAVEAGEGTITGERHSTLPAAMDAAYRLAVAGE